MEKTYLINGEEVDSYGNPTKTKKTSKAVSILLAIALAGSLSVGVTLASNGIVSLLTKEDTIIATVAKEDQKENYTITLSNGTNILSTKEDILNQISNQDNICVNGIYYSNNETRLIHIEASYETKYITELEKETLSAPSGYIKEGNKAVKYVIKKVNYILTPEEYATSLNEILNQNPGLKNYSGKLVEARPLSELYELLGVEQPKTNKLSR